MMIGLSQHPTTTTGTAEAVESGKAFQCLFGEWRPLTGSAEFPNVHALFQPSQKLHNPQKQVEVWRELCDATLLNGTFLIEGVHPAHSVKHAICHPYAHVLVARPKDHTKISQRIVNVVLV